MSEQQGKILKGIGGFYYVEAAGTVYECKARGVFRKNRITPLVGDFVTITVNNNAENTIDEIHKRKNFLNRPPVSNIDSLIIVISTTEPKPNFLVADRLIANAEYKNIEPVIAISKGDILPVDVVKDVYAKSGIKVISLDDNGAVDELKSLMEGKTTAFTGNSGVGKSTLLNRIDPTLNLSTAPISQKLGRGRHTTRQAELFKICGGFVVDTPGFSSFEFDKNEMIPKDELAYCFREFREYLGGCKFSTCSHTGDKGCKIGEAVADGKISEMRYNDYIALYKFASEIKEWEIK